LVKTRAEADDVYAQVTAPARVLTLWPSGFRSSSVKQNPAASIRRGVHLRLRSRCVMQVQPGEISKPVHSFGWHVIL
jgi:hypothetical protein